jgi:hypothetical protein
MRTSDATLGSDYDTGSQTESTPSELSTSVEENGVLKVDEELYGTTKPKRELIRAKIIREHDE